LFSAYSYEFETFYAFTLLMSHVKDNFIKTLDNTEDGIKARLTIYNEYLKTLDNELYLHLENEGINP